jgi:radical SAM superfamily enzyme YgiQ (UPF0313 family)
VFDGARLAGDAALEGFLAQVAGFDPGWCFVATSLAVLAREVGFAQRLRELTGANVVLFGAAAEAFAPEILAHGAADAVVAGEVEAVAPALVAGTPLAEVPGLWFLEGSTPRCTGRALVQDLDRLPFPDWGAVPLARYCYHPLLPRTPFATISSSRGCSFACDYCPYAAVQGTCFRAQSPGRTLDELEQLARVHRVRSVLFRDPNFALDRGRVLALCEGMVRRGLRLDWGCETRLDLLDDELCEALARAGCRNVEVGLDSLSGEAMAAHHRLTRAPAFVRERVRALVKRGVGCTGLFVVGLPGDTEASVRATMDFADTLDLTWINYQTPVPFPGTPLYERSLSQGLLARLTLDQLDGRTPLLAAPHLPLARLRALQSEGMRRFYLRPRRLLASLWTRDAWASTRFLAGATARFALRRLRGRA